MDSAQDYTSPPTYIGGFSAMMKMGKLFKDVSQPNDELFLFHKRASLVIAGHNFQLSYVPKDYKPPAKFKMSTGGFPLNLMMSMLMPKGAFKSLLEGMPLPIDDAKKHAEAWQAVLAWDFEAWTSSHDPPTICGPDLSGDEIKQLIRASLGRTGEDDPTGSRLKWNQKHA